MSLAATVALLDFTSRIFTRKVHIEKSLHGGIRRNLLKIYNIYCVFADRDFFRPLIEIRKAGMMVLLSTI
jgi:hypothetical protein